MAAAAAWFVTAASVTTQLFQCCCRCTCICVCTQHQAPQNCHSRLVSRSIRQHSRIADVYAAGLPLLVIGPQCKHQRWWTCGIHICYLAMLSYAFADKLAVAIVMSLRLCTDTEVKLGLHELPRSRTTASTGQCKLHICSHMTCSETIWSTAHDRGTRQCSHCSVCRQQDCCLLIRQA